MWVLPVNRRELVELLAPRADGRSIGALEDRRPSFDVVRSDRMMAVWPHNPDEFGRMPTALIISDDERLDVMAWLSTYVRDFRPFTAYCRVVERSIAEKFLHALEAPTLNRMEGVCTGLILGESLMHARGRSSILDLPFSAYSATLSHAISRSYAQTGGAIPLDQVAKLWSFAREITGQSALVPPSAILFVWSAALGMSRNIGHPKSLFNSSDILAHSWMEIASRGDLPDVLWHELVEGYKDLDSMRPILSMPREQRVHLIDTALHMLVSARGDEERRSFLAGYFTSLLGPGTLDHADFLTPVASALPTSYLWYGLFAGINPRGDALPVGNPLARRIIRDLTIPDRLIDRPRCDIALEELRMHGSPESILKMTSKAGRLDIDILPGVTTSVRWPPHEVPEEVEIKRHRDMEARHLLIEMEEYAMRSRQLAERLREVLRLEEPGRQSPMKKKRGGKN
jgi:hypothetical protein